MNGSTNVCSFLSHGTIALLSIIKVGVIIDKYSNKKQTPHVHQWLHKGFSIPQLSLNLTKT